MRTTTLACARCAGPVDPADRSCGRCGQPLAAAAATDLRVEHTPAHRPARGVPPAVVVASVMLLLAAGVAALALWWSLSGPSGGPATAAATPSAPSPSTTTSSAQPTAATSSAPPSSSASASSSPAGDGTSLTGAASAQVPATSPDAVDGAGGRVGYGADNMLDGDPATTWRMDGDGTGKVVTFVLDGPRTVVDVGLVNGYAKDDPATGTDRYAQSRRITRVTWTVGEEEVTQNLVDGDRGMQTVPVPPTQARTITMRIDTVTAPGVARFDQTAISEVALLGR